MDKDKDDHKKEGRHKKVEVRVKYILCELDIKTTIKMGKIAKNKIKSPLKKSLHNKFIKKFKIKECFVKLDKIKIHKYVQNISVVHNVNVIIDNDILVVNKVKIKESS